MSASAVCVITDIFAMLISQLTCEEVNYTWYDLLFYEATTNNRRCIYIAENTSSSYRNISVCLRITQSKNIHIKTQT